MTLNWPREETALPVPEHEEVAEAAPLLQPPLTVQLRFLCPDDLYEVRNLCTDWFPINYPFSWYVDITSSTRFYALAATYNLQIVGLIVAEIRSYLKLNREDRTILSEDSLPKDSQVGYILSLGVHKSFRRQRIASVLLDALLKHLTTDERLNKVKAVYLHTACNNVNAIKFYESRRFVLHSMLPYYYSIGGRSKDGYTFVTYLNGGSPPWTISSGITRTISGTGAREYLGWGTFAAGSLKALQGSSVGFTLARESYAIEYSSIVLDKSGESSRPQQIYI